MKVNKKEVDFLTEKFINKTSYIGVGAGLIAKMFDVNRGSVVAAKILAKDKLKTLVHPESNGKRNVMIIGDTHFPFEHEDALKACIKAHSDYAITDVIHIGDVIDLHAVSYHESSTKAHGPNAEFQLAKNKVKEWAKEFPNVMVTTGNHGALAQRKAQSGSIPDQFVRPLSEALDVPGWNWTDSVTIGNVFFTHGIGGVAKTRAKQLGMSVVSGHYHSQKYIEYTDHNHKNFAMQVGCMVDKSSYAMEYAKHSVIAEGFGVILDCEGDNPTPIMLNI